MANARNHFPPERGESNAQCLELLREGFHQHQRSDLDAAKATYQRILDIQPENLDALQLMGVLLAQRGDPSAAINYFEKAIALNTEQPGLYANCGRAYMDLGLWQQAITCYDLMIALAPETPEGNMRRAECQFRLGDLDQAISGYQRVVGLSPEDHQAWAALAHVYQESEDYERSLTALNRAIEVAPHEASYYANQSLLLQHLGRLEEALVATEKALQLDPSLRDTWIIQGDIQKILGQLKESLKSYEAALEIDPLCVKALCLRVETLQCLKAIHDEEALQELKRALSLDPESEDAWHALGAFYQSQQRSSEAQSAFESVIAIHPQSKVGYLKLGVLLFDLHEHAEALNCFDQAMEIDPQMAEAYTHRALTLIKLGREEEALLSADSAIRLKPSLADAHHCRGLALAKLLRFKEAADAFSIGIDLQPDHAEAFTNRATMRVSMDELEAARSDFTQAIKLQPNLADAHVNLLAILHLETLHLDDALAAFDRAIALAPESPDVHFNKALVQMLQGHLLEGFKGYEWRWKSYMRQSARDFGRPLWLGEESLLGRTILVSMEQGFGDFIQYARYLPLLAAKAAQVLVEVPLALKELMQTLEGAYRWVLPGEPLPPFDVYCPIMSLSLAFKTDMDSIPRSIPYLSVGETHQERWALKLGPKTQPRIGIVWSGSATHLHDRKRSIPFEHLKPLLQGPYEFHVLQKEIRDHEHAEVLSTPHLHLHSDDLQSFADTAGLLAQMDLVITVDTSVAHLAGALGFPVWVLVSYSPEWRWLLDRSDSPWYPSARVFRQSERGNWSEMIRRVKSALL